MPPASTTGPSKNARTARTNTNGLSQPVWPPAPAVSSTSPSAPAATARSAWRMLATSANTSAPASCSGSSTGAGEPTEVMTISGLCRSSTFRSASSRALERCTIRFGQIGAARLPLAVRCRRNRLSISPSQPSSCSALRQFTVGNAPITPLRHAATTRSTPDTRNIGAAISGRLRRSRKRASGSGEVEVVRSGAMMLVVPRLQCVVPTLPDSGTPAGRVRSPEELWAVIARSEHEMRQIPSASLRGALATKQSTVRHAARWIASLRSQ